LSSPPNKNINIQIRTTRSLIFLWKYLGPRSILVEFRKIKKLKFFFVIIMFVYCSFFVFNFFVNIYLFLVAVIIIFWKK